MIIAKLADIYNAKDTLKELSNIKLPALEAFNLLKILKLANDEISDFEKIRLQKIKEFGTKEENGAVIILPDNEYHHAFVIEMNDLLEKEITFEQDGIPLASFGKISAGMLNAISWLVK